MCLQAVEVLWLFGVMYDGVPLASWVSELHLSGEVKPIGEAEAKASLKWAILVARGRPEAR